MKLKSRQRKQQYPNSRGGQSNEKMDDKLGMQNENSE
jgi:hypothetical protein